MDEKLVEQILVTREAKDTEDLIKTWRENNRDEFSEECFEAIKRVLLKRGEELPPQKSWGILTQEEISASSITPIKTTQDGVELQIGKINPPKLILSLKNKEVKLDGASFKRSECYP
jgi:hypothetical protein